ncbi:MAG: hypothetical protein JWR38_4835 [Mucilaginibacter sp.]|nr:hypothetical protein [Mucilaginibacter sp.]
MQIRKYLNGELNANAMHQLEREALDDPFLMDALEGYETTGKDQQPNLSELSERLQQRTSEKRGRIIPWRAWSIAASVLVVLTIGGLWLKKTEPNEKQKTADVVLPAPHKATIEPQPDTLKGAASAMQVPLIAQSAKPAVPVSKPTAKSSDKAVYQQEISAADANVPATANNPVAVVEPPPPAAAAKAQEDKKDNTQQLSEAVVMGYTSKGKQDSIDNAVALNRRTRVAASSTTMLQGKVAGLTVIPADPKGQAEAQRITGIIISKDNGSPVIGAAIRVRGTNKSTVTNTAGHFALPITFGNAQTLDIVSIGYERKQVNVKGGDSLKVELNQDSHALSEVVVVRGDGGDEPAAESAHPQNGWSSLKKYLQANATLPDGTTGSVSVTFTVATDGTLSDIKIKKSLNTTADQKAIDLIKAGPSWVGNNNQKPEQVTVKVKFQQQK